MWQACVAAFPGAEILEVSPVRYYFVLLASRGGCDHRVFACGSLVAAFPDAEIEFGGEPCEVLFCASCVKGWV